MTVGYGSDNEGSEKTAILDVAPDARRVASTPSRIKGVVACVAAALTLAGAIVAFRAATTDNAVKVVDISQQPQSVTLASAHDSQNWWPTDHPVLSSGKEFMIMCANGGRCVDASETYLILAACDPKSINQIFAYEMDTNTIRTPRKDNLCWTDGGEKNNGFWRDDCKPGNLDTKFMYDWTTRLLHVAPKPGSPKYYDVDKGWVYPPEAGLCVDANKYLYQKPCDPDQPSEQFEIVPKAYW